MCQCAISVIELLISQKHSQMVGSQLQSEVTPLDVLVRALPNLPGPLQQSLLCQLLRTSSSVAAAIYKHCLGKLSLSFSTYDINTLKGTFLPWLSKHGCLLSRWGFGRWWVVCVCVGACKSYK